MVLPRGLSDSVFLVLTSCRVQTVPSGQFTAGWSFWPLVRPSTSPTVPAVPGPRQHEGPCASGEGGGDAHTLHPTAEPPWSPAPRPPFLFHDVDIRASKEALAVKNPPAVQETESHRLNP